MNGRRELRNESTTCRPSHCHPKSHKHDVGQVQRNTVVEEVVHKTGRVAQRDVPSIARLILCAPYVDACHSARRQPEGERGQYCASAAPHVKHAFVAAQMQVIQNLVPLEKLAVPGGVEKAAGIGEKEDEIECHSHGRADLTSALPEESHAALRHWQERIDRTIAKSFAEAEEQQDASIADREGLGVPLPAVHRVLGRDRAWFSISRVGADAAWAKMHRPNDRALTMW